MGKKYNLFSAVDAENLKKLQGRKDKAWESPSLLLVEILLENLPESWVFAKETHPEYIAKTANNIVAQRKAELSKFEESLQNKVLLKLKTQYPRSSGKKDTKDTDIPSYVDVVTEWCKDTIQAIQNGTLTKGESGSKEEKEYTREILKLKAVKKHMSEVNFGLTEAAEAREKAEQKLNALLKGMKDKGFDSEAAFFDPKKYLAAIKQLIKDQHTVTFSEETLQWISPLINEGSILDSCQTKAREAYQELLQAEQKKLGAAIKAAADSEKAAVEKVSSVIALSAKKHKKSITSASTPDYRKFTQTQFQTLSDELKAEVDKLKKPVVLGLTSTHAAVVSTPKKEQHDHERMLLQIKQGVFQKLSDSKDLFKTDELKTDEPKTLDLAKIPKYLSDLSAAAASAVKPATKDELIRAAVNDQLTDFLGALIDPKILQKQYQDLVFADDTDKAKPATKEAPPAINLSDMLSALEEQFPDLTNTQKAEQLLVQLYEAAEGKTFYQRLAYCDAQIAAMSAEDLERPVGAALNAAWLHVNNSRQQVGDRIANGMGVSLKTLGALTEAEQQSDDIYKKYGLKREEVSDNGDCQFIAIAKQLLQLYPTWDVLPENLQEQFSAFADGKWSTDAIEGETGISERLRKIATEFMRAKTNRDRFQCAFEAPQEPNPLHALVTDNFENYCKYMVEKYKKDKDDPIRLWGDQLTLVAIKEALGLPIVILHQSQGKQGPRIDYQLNQSDDAKMFALDKAILLSYVNGNHYETVQRPSLSSFQRMIGDSTRIKNLQYTLNVVGLKHYTSGRLSSSKVFMVYQFEALEQQYKQNQDPEAYLEAIDKFIEKYESTKVVKETDGGSLLKAFRDRKDVVQKGINAAKKDLESVLSDPDVTILAKYNALNEKVAKVKASKSVDLLDLESTGTYKFSLLKQRQQTYTKLAKIEQQYHTDKNLSVYIQALTAVTKQRETDSGTRAWLESKLGELSAFNKSLKNDSSRYMDLSKAQIKEAAQKLSETCDTYKWPLDESTELYKKEALEVRVAVLEKLLTADLFTEATDETQQMFDLAKIQKLSKASKASSAGEVETGVVENAYQSFLQDLLHSPQAQGVLAAKQAFEDLKLNLSLDTHQQSLENLYARLDTINVLQESLNMDKYHGVVAANKAFPDSEEKRNAFIQIYKAQFDALLKSQTAYLEPAIQIQEERAELLANKPHAYDDTEESSFRNKVEKHISRMYTIRDSVGTTEAAKVYVQAYIDELDKIFDRIRALDGGGKIANALAELRSNKDTATAHDWIEEGLLIDKGNVEADKQAQLEKIEKQQQLLEINKRIHDDYAIQSTRSPYADFKAVIDKIEAHIKDLEGANDVKNQLEINLFKQRKNKLAVAIESTQKLIENDLSNPSKCLEILEKEMQALRAKKGEQDYPLYTYRLYNQIKSEIEEGIAAAKELAAGVSEVGDLVTRASLAKRLESVNERIEELSAEQAKVDPKLISGTRGFFELQQLQEVEKPVLEAEQKKILEKADEEVLGYISELEGCKSREQFAGLSNYIGEKIAQYEAEESKGTDDQALFYRIQALGVLKGAVDSMLSKHIWNDDAGELDLAALHQMSKESSESTERSESTLLDTLGSADRYLATIIKNLATPQTIAAQAAAQHILEKNFEATLSIPDRIKEISEQLEQVNELAETLAGEHYSKGTKDYQTCLEAYVAGYKDLKYEIERLQQLEQQYKRAGVAAAKKVLQDAGNTIELQVKAVTDRMGTLEADKAASINIKGNKEQIELETLSKFQGVLQKITDLQVEFSANPEFYLSKLQTWLKTDESKNAMPGDVNEYKNELYKAEVAVLEKAFAEVHAVPALAVLKNLLLLNTKTGFKTLKESIEDEHRKIVSATAHSSDAYKQAYLQARLDGLDSFLDLADIFSASGELQLDKVAERLAEVNGLDTKGYDQKQHAAHEYLITLCQSLSDPEKIAEVEADKQFAAQKFDDVNVDIVERAKAVTMRLRVVEGGSFADAKTFADKIFSGVGNEAKHEKCVNTYNARYKQLLEGQHTRLKPGADVVKDFQDGLQNILSQASSSSSYSSSFFAELYEQLEAQQKKLKKLVDDAKAAGSPTHAAHTQLQKLEVELQDVTKMVDRFDLAGTYLYFPAIIVGIGIIAGIDGRINDINKAATLTLNQKIEVALLTAKKEVIDSANGVVKALTDAPDANPYVYQAAIVAELAKHADYKKSRKPNIPAHYIAAFLQSIKTPLDDGITNAEAVASDMTVGVAEQFRLVNDEINALKTTKSGLAGSKEAVELEFLQKLRQPVLQELNVLETDGTNGASNPSRYLIAIEKALVTCNESIEKAGLKLASVQTADSYKKSLLEYKRDLLEKGIKAAEGLAMADIAGLQNKAEIDKRRNEISDRINALKTGTPGPETTDAYELAELQHAQAGINAVLGKAAIFGADDNLVQDQIQILLNANTKDDSYEMQFLRGVGITKELFLDEEIKKAFQTEGLVFSASGSTSTTGPGSSTGGSVGHSAPLSVEEFANNLKKLKKVLQDNSETNLNKTVAAAPGHLKGSLTSEELKQSLQKAVSEQLSECAIQAIQGATATGNLFEQAIKISTIQKELESSELGSTIASSSSSSSSSSLAKAVQEIEKHMPHQVELQKSLLGASTEQKEEVASLIKESTINTPIKEAVKLNTKKKFF